MPLHQIHLHLIVFDAHIEIVNVGIFEALLFFPHLFVELATNVGTNLLERGEFRHELPIAEERVEELAEGAVLEGANSPRLFGREVFERSTIIDRFGIAGDEVGDGMSLF